MPRFKNKDLYQKKYPHYLPWHKALWIVKVGDYIKIDNVPHIVKNVELSAIRGSLPRITVEQITSEEIN